MPLSNIPASPVKAGRTGRNRTKPRRLRECGARPGPDQGADGVAGRTARKDYAVITLSKPARARQIVKTSTKLLPVTYADTKRAKRRSYLIDKPLKDTLQT